MYLLFLIYNSVSLCSLDTRIPSLVSLFTFMVSRVWWDASQHTWHNAHWGGGIRKWFFITSFKPLFCPHFGKIRFFLDLNPTTSSKFFGWQPGQKVPLQTQSDKNLKRWRYRLQKVERNSLWIVTQVLVFKSQSLSRTNYKIFWMN